MRGSGSMPEVKIVAPVAVLPSDRLTLCATDVRGALSFGGAPASPYGCSALCTAED